MTLETFQMLLSVAQGVVILAIAYILWSLTRALSPKDKP